MKRPPTYARIPLKFYNNNEHEIDKMMWGSRYCVAITHPRYKIVPFATMQSRRNFLKKVWAFKHKGGHKTMMTIEQRYHCDPIITAFVRSMEQVITDLQLTPTEVRECAMLACINVENRRPAWRGDL